MKIAITIPDDLFESAKDLSLRTRKSISRMFRDALQEYLARHTPDHVTEAMNHALTELETSDDPFISKMARRVLKRSEW